MPEAAAPPSEREERSPAVSRPRVGPRLVLDWMKILWEGVGTTRALGLAAEMAFWLFFSLLPLAAVGGLVLARLQFEGGDVVGTMLGSTPPAVRELIATQLGQVAKWNGGAVGPLAAVVFVWLASSGIHSIFETLEVQAGVARPWWKKRALALVTCGGLSVGVALLALLGTGLGWLFRLAGTALPHALTSSHGSGLFTLTVRILLGVLIAFGLVAGLYTVGTPRVVHRPFTVVPGTLLAVSLQALSGFGYGLYIHLMGTGNAYQAGLGIVGVTLMSLYLFCLALLVGAELNQAMSDRHASTHASSVRGAASRRGLMSMIASGIPGV
jgi:membrane protein